MLEGIFEAFTIIESFGKKLDYFDWLKTLEGHRAVDLGKKECQRCGFCCARRPCVPSPEELHTIAKYLGMPIKNLVANYFVVEATRDKRFFIFPAKETQLDLCGKIVPWQRTFDRGYCVFYEKTKKECVIYPAIPLSAKLSSCWQDKQIEISLGDKIMEQNLEAWEKLKDEELETIINNAIVEVYGNDVRKH